ncbi:protein ITPRID2 [Coccinella septempunctata]|uniref:protein ITPRID2 n=1 Tax=Coccinella septempunctata TaxID=41139 RepID=UPI001D0721E4|nr:protein ITPRID2 [Coccinella septempunctata]XP_044751094.1 protein ITPRID2 [Coccinella septempunctata]
MSKSPVTVQQWIESLPPPEKTAPPFIPPTTVSTKTVSPARNARRYLPRDLSLQSDDASSHCSSVESVLELRKPDPEAVLMSLGFGPSKPSNLLSKIPQRFLQPSQLITSIDLDKFLEQYGESPTELSDIQNPKSPFDRATKRPRSF